jgi:hypothetical protein
MRILITKSKPTTKPLREYETTYIYVSFKFRYDSHTKMLSSIEKDSDGTMIYTELPSQTTVFSRAYHTEHVRVSVYSDSPRIWTEETSPYDFFTFVQQPTQAA